MILEELAQVGTKQLKTIFINKRMKDGKKEGRKEGNIFTSSSGFSSSIL
jgi:hypothetical protein